MAAIYAVPVRSDSEYRERVGIALATIRDYRGMSQDDLAAAADTSTSTVSRGERGLGEIQGHTMVRLARTLRVPLEFLMDPPATREDVLIAMGHWVAKQRADESEPS